MATRREVSIPLKSSSVSVRGDLTVPQGASGLVLFVHGSGSSRLSPRNQYVAQILNEGGLATLLFDLLTPEEEVEDDRTKRLRFDMELLGDRVLDATSWVLEQEDLVNMKLGYFGASSGGGAALRASVLSKKPVSAVVSRGGRPDLCGELLGKVTSPTLLIIGGLDTDVIRLNEQAFRQLKCEKEMKIIPGATHLFEEKGKLQEVSLLAQRFLSTHLQSSAAR